MKKEHQWNCLTISFWALMWSFCILHTVELRDWYQEKLGLIPGYGDAHWQEFTMSQGSRFGLDFTGYPRSVIEKQAVMVSFKVADIHQAVDQLKKREFLLQKLPRVLFSMWDRLWWQHFRTLTATGCSCRKGNKRRLSKITS